jgi:hypothetical protein
MRKSADVVLCREQLTAVEPHGCVSRRFFAGQRPGG